MDSEDSDKTELKSRLVRLIAGYVDHFASLLCTDSLFLLIHGSNSVRNDEIFSFISYRFLILHACLSGCMPFSVLCLLCLCASVYMCLVVTCWERADLLALVCGVQL